MCVHLFACEQVLGERERVSTKQSNDQREESVCMYRAYIVTSEKVYDELGFKRCRPFVRFFYFFFFSLGLFFFPFLAFRIALFFSTINRILIPSFFFFLFPFPLPSFLPGRCHMDLETRIVRGYSFRIDCSTIGNVQCIETKRKRKTNSLPGNLGFLCGKPVLPGHRVLNNLI